MKVEAGLDLTTAVLDAHILGHVDPRLSRSRTTVIPLFITTGYDEPDSGSME